jgi:uncharacterized protein DUF3846
MKAILIQNEGGPVVIELPEDSSDGGEVLAELQRIVDGRIEALAFPAHEGATVYIEEESLYNKTINRQATAIMAPIIMPGTAIHGPMLICGFDAAKGRTATVPDELIEAYVTAPDAANMSRPDGMGRTDGMGSP